MRIRLKLDSSIGFIGFKMILFFLLVIQSCNYFEDKNIEITHKVFLDNPSNQNIDIYINGQKNKVKKHHTEVLELEPGNYHFKGLNSSNEKIFESNIQIDTSVLVNIAKTDYWIVGEIYADDDTYWEHVKLDTIVMDNHTIIGNIQVLDRDQLFFKKEWDFNLDEDFGDTMNIHKKFYLGKKIFRRADYIKQYYNK